jgi:hypothetical protein
MTGVRPLNRSCRNGGFAFENLDRGKYIDPQVDGRITREGGRKKG